MDADEQTVSCLAKVRRNRAVTHRFNAMITALLMAVKDGADAGFVGFYILKLFFWL